MKHCNYILIICGILSGCSFSKQQYLSNAGGKYDVEWQGNRVTQIKFKSQDSASNFVIHVTWGGSQRTVKINSKKDPIWADDYFLPYRQGGSCSGIVVSDRSRLLGADYEETFEWKLESNNYPIYREVKLLDQNYNLKSMDFYGPGNIKLIPPK